jgi:hypothetical protein
MYYRLWYSYEMRYLASCYNSKGLNALRQQFLLFIKPELDPSDPDDNYSWESLQICPDNNLMNRLEAWGYIVEESIKAFKPICKQEILSF